MATLNDSPVAGNVVAEPGGGVARGGGIDVINGGVTVDHGVISGNDADPRGALPPTVGEYISPAAP